MPFTLLFVFQFLLGFGLIRRFTLISKPAQSIALSVLAGFFLSTLVIFILELLNIPLNVKSILASVALVALVLNFDVKRLRDEVRRHTRKPLFSLKMYESAFILTIAYMLFFSFWRTYYLPVTPYDSIVGIDLVAREALAEGHIVSSIFTQKELVPFLSTQPYYAPFSMLMQIMYRAVGFPFGQVWLGLLNVAFVIFAYSKMCEKLHPIVAGAAILLLYTAPELYAYTFLLQTDFANAVFFTIGLLFLVEFLETKENQPFLLSALFMAAACWTRTETIVLVGAITVILFVALRKILLAKACMLAAIYASLPALTTVLWNLIFFKFYLPISPKVAEQVDWVGTYGIKTSLQIFNGMNAYLFSLDYWGFMIPAFLTVWVINFFVHPDRKCYSLIGWLLLCYVCFFLMLHHFKLMNVEYTFRRAIMKFLLVMCVFCSRIPILQRP